MNILITHIQRHVKYNLPIKICKISAYPYKIGLMQKKPKMADYSSPRCLVISRWLVFLFTLFINYIKQSILS